MTATQTCNEYNILFYALLHEILFAKIITPMICIRFEMNQQKQQKINVKQPPLSIHRFNSKNLTAAKSEYCIYHNVSLFDH